MLGVLVHRYLLNQGPRSQLDRYLFKRNMQRAVEQVPNLTVLEASVHGLDLAWQKDSLGYADPDIRARVRGVYLGTWVHGRMPLTRTASGEHIPCDQVVLCTGTFLSGVVRIGLDERRAGRMLPMPQTGDEPSTEALGESLVRAGFRLQRLKTGTPPRLDASSVALGQRFPGEPGRGACNPRFEVIEGDARPQAFSFLHPSGPPIDAATQLRCWGTHTTPETHAIVVRPPPARRG